MQLIKHMFLLMVSHHCRFTPIYTVQDCCAIWAATHEARLLQLIVLLSCSSDYVRHSMPQGCIRLGKASTTTCTNNSTFNSSVSPHFGTRLAQPRACFSERGSGLQLSSLLLPARILTASSGDTHVPAGAMGLQLHFTTEQL